MHETKQELPKTAADFFAGIGLVTMGLKRQQWEVVYAVDYDETKRTLYEGHFGKGHYHVKDVLHVSGDEAPTVTLAHASFPCTDFSLAGSRNGLDGKESPSVNSFLRILQEMGGRRPPLVMLENVEGFLTSDGGHDLAFALSELGRLGYGVDALLINAAHFVPQSRVRLFIIGALGGQPQDFLTIESILDRKHAARPPKVVEFIKRRPDLRWRLRILPDLPRLERRIETIVEDDSAWWPNERTDYLLDQMFERHRRWITEHINSSDFHYATAFRRMRLRDGEKRSTAELRTDGIAGCLRTPKGGSARQIVVRVGKGRVDARLLNGRECAALMGADDFTLDPSMSLNDVLFGFGDAVAVPVVEWIARVYLDPLCRELATWTPMNENGHYSDDPVRITSVPGDNEHPIWAAFEQWCSAAAEGSDLPLRGRTYAALVCLDRLTTTFNLDPSFHKTANGSSVKQLTAPNIRRILSRFGETRPVPTEAGRTSRGTLHFAEDLLSRLKTAGFDMIGLNERNELLEAMISRLVWVAGQYHERSRITFEYNPTPYSGEGYYDDP